MNDLSLKGHSEVFEVSLHPGCYGTGIMEMGMMEQEYHIQGK